MATHDEALKKFVDELYADNYTEHEVMSFAPTWDSDLHAPGHDGRQLVLEGSVVLEVAGKTRVFEAGETYEVPANTMHREVFGEGGARLCIGRRKKGEPPLRGSGTRCLHKGRKPC